MVDFSQMFVFVTLLPKSQSHPQIQFSQCVVGCQCFPNVVCSFCSNLFFCEWFISVKSVFSWQCCQNHNLTPKSNVVNVLLIFNACPMFFAPSSPISLNCEWLISVKSVFSLHCCQNHNLTSKCNVVHVLLVANACPMFFAPSAPILLNCE